MVTHSGRLSAWEVIIELRVGAEDVVGVVELPLFATFWTPITVWEVVQPRIVEPISVYVYEKQAGDPASVLLDDLLDRALSKVMYKKGPVTISLLVYWSDSLQYKAPSL